MTVIKVLKENVAVTYQFWAKAHHACLKYIKGLPTSTYIAYESRDPWRMQINYDDISPASYHVAAILNTVYDYFVEWRRPAISSSCFSLNTKITASRHY